MSFYKRKTYIKGNILFKGMHMLTAAISLLLRCFNAMQRKIGTYKYILYHNLSAKMLDISF